PDRDREERHHVRRADLHGLTDHRCRVRHLAHVRHEPVEQFVQVHRHRVYRERFFFAGFFEACFFVLRAAPPAAPRTTVKLSSIQRFNVARDAPASWMVTHPVFPTFTRSPIFVASASDASSFNIASTRPTKRNAFFPTLTVCFSSGVPSHATPSSVSG